MNTAKTIICCSAFVQLVSSAHAAEKAADPMSAVSSDVREDDTESRENAQGILLEEVVVTGSHIRGETSPGSSVTVYTRGDIVRSGAATVDQFARQILSNFSSADTTANSLSTAIGARFNNATLNNAFGGAAFNLHGLGTSATLVLLNGHRLAPAGLDGSLVDASEIPLSSVDHIEVLDSGASAIYGADAVAGVVNIITRRDYSGAETSLNYGTSTSGGATDFTASQAAGTRWNSGGAMVSYEFSDNGGLDAHQRSDYIPDLGGPYSLIPKNRRHSLLASASQWMDSDTNLSIDGFYSDRAFDAQHDLHSLIAQSTSPEGGYAKQWGLTGGIDRTLIRDWHLNVSGNYSRLDQYSDTVSNTVSPFGNQSAENTAEVVTSVVEADVLANGSLLTLPGGPLKAAIGLNWRQERFASGFGETIDDVFSAFNVPALNRHVSSAFGELAVPVIGASNAQAWAKRLEFSFAARWDHYSDFGSATNPKVGVLFEPVAGFELRGSYGKSFHAPLLEQIGEAQTINEGALPNANSPLGFSDTLVINGGNPALRPETAKSYTVGFAITPELVSNLKFNTTFFHIAYDNRISTPPVSGLNYFNDPALAPFLNTAPSIALVESYFAAPGFQGDALGLGPQGVSAIFDQRSANIASTVESGVDVTADYAVPLTYGQLGIGMGASYLAKNEFQAVSSVPAVDLLNDYAQPMKWRGRGDLSYAYAGFAAMVQINYTNRYTNSLAQPAQTVDSWSTADLYLGYETGNTGSEFTRNLRVGLNVQNITNKRPPYTNLSAFALLPGERLPPFDPANASPVGRFISLQASKQW